MGNDSTPSGIPDVLEPHVYQPTAVDLFRFSAATNNPHLIHYNAEHALAEGFPGIVVQSHMHAAYIYDAVERWTGGAQVLSLSWRNVAVAVAGDRLEVTGTFVSNDQVAEGQGARLEILTQNQHGDTVVSADCVVRF